MVSSQTEDFLKGVELFHNHKWEEAVFVLEPLIGKSNIPNSIYIILGEAFISLGKFKKAHDYVNSFVTEYPSHYGGRLLLAKIKAMKDPLNESRVFAKQLLTDYPQDHRILSLLANIEFSQNNFEESLIYFKRASLIREDLGAIYLQLCYIYLEMGDLIKADEMKLRAKSVVVEGDSLYEILHNNKEKEDVIHEYSISKK